MGVIVRALGHAEAVAKRLDAARWAPNQVAERALEGLYDRRVKLIEADPEWMEIQLRRTGDNGATVGAGSVGWLETERQIAIGEAVAPEPSWAGIAFRVERWRLRDLVRRGKSFLERGDRGWAGQDTWDLGTYLARVTGEALEALAENAQSWPEGEFASFADWQAALRAHSEALLVWGRGEGGKAEAERWSELAESGDHEVEADEAWVALAEAEEAARARAEVAMVWVAAHMDTLWD